MAGIYIRHMCIQVECKESCTFRPFLMHQGEGPFQDCLSTALPPQLLRPLAMLRTRLRSRICHICSRAECIRECTMRSSLMHKREGRPFRLQQGLGRPKRWAWRILPLIRRSRTVSLLRPARGNSRRCFRRHMQPRPFLAAG